MQTSDNTLTFAKQVEILHIVRAKLADIKEYLDEQETRPTLYFHDTLDLMWSEDSGPPKLNVYDTLDAVEEDITYELGQRLKFLEAKRPNNE
jgi:hypothetical protein